MKTCHIAALASLAAVSLTACSSTASGDHVDQTPPITTGCQAQSGQELIGQTANADTGARAMALTGAQTLRWGPPNAAFTMDYRADRVNVIYGKDMVITEITCG